MRLMSFKDLNNKKKINRKKEGKWDPSKFELIAEYLYADFTFFFFYF